MSQYFQGIPQQQMSSEEELDAQLRAAEESARAFLEAQGATPELSDPANARAPGLSREDLAAEAARQGATPPTDDLVPQDLPPQLPARTVQVDGSPDEDIEMAAAKVEDRQARAREAFERGSRELVAGITRTAPTAATRQPQDAVSGLMGRRKLRDDTHFKNEGMRLDAEKVNYGRKKDADAAALGASRLDFERKRHDTERGQDLAEREKDDKRAEAGNASREALAREMAGLRTGEVKTKAKVQASDDTSELRKEFNTLPDVKTFGEIDSAYNKVSSAAANPSAAGDLSLIFAYMKVLDPGSTVREGEFANAQNASGVPERIQAQWNRLQNGERLSNEQRKDFVSQTEKLYSVHKNRYEAQAKRYRELAAKRGFDTSDVVPTTRVSGGDGKVTVSNGKETLRINASDLKAAEADGYKRVSQ